MTDFYFTFGNNMGVDRNGYIRITAPTVQDARTAMCQIHGNKWSFCYGIESFKFDYFPAGELAHFEFNPATDTDIRLIRIIDPSYRPLINWVGESK